MIDHRTWLIEGSRAEQEKCNSSWDSLDILQSLHSRFFHDRRSNGPANVMQRCIPGVEAEADIGTSAHLP